MIECRRLTVRDYLTLQRLRIAARLTQWRIRWKTRHSIDWSPLTPQDKARTRELAQELGWDKGRSDEQEP